MKFWVFVFCVFGVNGQNREEGTLEYKLNGMEIISLNDVAPTPIDSENQDAANNSNPSSQPIDRNEDESFIVKRLIEMLMQATAGTAENSTETAISVDNSTEVAPHTTNPANVLIQQLQSLPHPVIDQLLQLLNVSFSNETTEYEGTTPHAIDNDIDSIESTTVMEKTARSANPEPYFLPVAIFSNSSSGSQVVSSSNTSTPLPNVTASTTSPPTTMTYNRYDAGSDNVKEGYIPDYFVFAVLRNGTIIRKRPNRVVPNVFYMFLEDGTLIQKFPNGSTSVVPLAPVIQVTGFDTREFPASENGNETKSSLVNMTTVEPESTPSSFEIRLGVEDATETVGDVNTTQTTSSSEGSMETTQASTTPLSTTASVKSTTSTSPTTRGEEMTAPPFTNPIESDDGELVITEAVTSPTTLMGNGSTLPLPSGRSIDLSIAGPLLINTTSATTQHLPGNFHLKDEEKRDLLLIESLIKKQQAVLEQLTTLTKLRIENAQPQQSESLAQRVISSVADMTTTSVEPSSPSTTSSPSTVTPAQPTHQDKKKEPPITRKQIQLLIQQLEAIRKNPAQVKKLDLSALKKLQKFENVMTMKTPRQKSVHVTNDTKRIDLLQAPEIRAQLSDYAVNISKAISSFFGSALQDASEKFVSSLRMNSSEILSGLTAG